VQHLIIQYGYVAVFLLMLAESACIPIPSEVIMLFAGALAAGAAASVFALLVGLPLARLSGISASIGSFAVLAVVNAVLSNWTSMTGGQGSLYGLPSYANIWTTLPWALAALALAWTYQQSRFGLRLRGAQQLAHLPAAHAVAARHLVHEGDDLRALQIEGGGGDRLGERRSAGECRKEREAGCVQLGSDEFAP